MGREKVKLICKATVFLFLNSIVTSSLAVPVIDPLDSPSWKLMHSVMLNDEEVVFDDRVEVMLPDFAEDPMSVPVSIHIHTIENIEDIIVFADLNPIQKILNFKPYDIKPHLSFRIKVEQSTPVRAAVKTSDGVWHVGGRWLEAAGGGCTAPSHGRAVGNWHTTLMNVAARSWNNTEFDRIRFRIMHPMDTGLAEGIPEFYLEYFDVTDAKGVILAKVTTYQPISENPVFTLNMNEGVAMPVSLVGKDNNGNRLNVQIR